MSTASLSGKTGSAEGQSGNVTEVRKWEATLAADMLDATSFASEGWREKIAGLQSVSGSLEAVGNKAFIMADSLTPFELTLVTAAGGPSIVGDALLSNIKIVSEAAGEVVFTANFESTGEWTQATASGLKAAKSKGAPVIMPKPKADAK